MPSTRLAKLTLDHATALFIRGGGQAADADQQTEKASRPVTTILGIVNITRDSFSSGGKFLDPAAAIAHARQLSADGADVIDLGAESTHPDSEDVSAEDEIARLTPVIKALKSEGICISVDTHKPQVMRHVLSLGVDMINDVWGLRDPASASAVRDSNTRLILVHSRSPTARAERSEADPATIIDTVLRFFEGHIATLVGNGIARDRLILDPGMGFFLGGNAEASLAVLRQLPRLSALGLPILVSTSRKSFIGTVLGGSGQPRPVDQRGAGTLATELWAVQHGATFIRTHNALALRDALYLTAAIRGMCT